MRACILGGHRQNIVMTPPIDEELTEQTNDIISHLDDPMSEEEIEEGIRQLLDED